MSRFSFKDLPEKIRVKVKKSKNKYLIDLLDYEVFTEADSVKEIEFMINDLIYTYFGIPKKIQSQIYYRPVKTEPNKIEGIEIPSSLAMLVPNFPKLVNSTPGVQNMNCTPGVLTQFMDNFSVIARNEVTKQSPS